jgi:hypothetical protein
MGIPCSVRFRECYAIPPFRASSLTFLRSQYTLYEGTSVAAFFLSAFFLVLAIVLLVPDPPVAQDSGSDVPPSQV